VYRPHPARRQACRSSGRDAEQVRNHPQPQDRQSARPRRAPVPAGARRRGDRMRRRAFLLGFGGAAVWPLVARAQQPLPTVGLLSSVPFNTRRDQLYGFRHGLAEAGFVEGRTVRIEYRSAENQSERLPALAADLVERRVNVIVTIGGDNSAKAAKDATSAIPVVFVTGLDPV